MSFYLLAVRFGPHWKLSPDEERAFAAAFAPLLKALLDKFSGLVVYGGLAGISVLSLILPRLEKDALLEKERQERAGRREPPADTQPGGSS